MKNLGLSICNNNGKKSDKNNIFFIKLKSVFIIHNIVKTINKFIRFLQGFRGVNEKDFH